MTRSPARRSARELIRVELRHLTAFQPSTRRWQMPVGAAAASGLPLLIAAYFGRMDYGVVASLGGLVFLYLPGTPLHHRMAVLMAASFAMSASYALGTISHMVPPLIVPVLTFIAILVTMVCRFYAIGPPGSLFFIMAAAIGAYSGARGPQVLTQIGVITLGTLLACLIAFFYSLYVLRLAAPRPVAPLPRPTFDFVVFDSVVIGLCVGLSLALAQLFQLQRPYWVPVSCLAVIQGMSMRAVWNRQVHRIIGTSIGLLLAWGLLALPLNPWSVSLLLIVLTFLVETLVVRHYGMAAIFITPLTILLADSPHLGSGSAGAIIQARFIDTVLGCTVGLLGGVCLHSPRFREVVGRQMRRLTPSRLGR